MKFKYGGMWLVFLFSLIISWPQTPRAEDPQSVGLKGLKRQVAVVDFENKSDYGEHNVGRGMADMLITALVKSGSFDVIEREALEQVINEQKLGLSGAVTPQSAAQVGRLLGVNAVITGSITEFGQAKEKGGVQIKGFKLGGDVNIARVAVDLRLINVATGQIELAETCTGEEKKSGGSIATREFAWGSGSDFDKTLVGKATRKAIDKIVELVVAQMEHLPWEGKIIKVADDGTVFMKPGSAAGVRPGMVFAVYRPGEELIDPDTGLSLGSEESKIGAIQVVEDAAQGKAAKAIIKSGTGFETGDILRVQ